MTEDNDKLGLNTLKPARGSKTARRRVGRGGGSGFGKTCGRGNKGQKARAGSSRRIGFEGGQMPLQRRLPKIGFRSMNAGRNAEIRLHELELAGSDTVDRAALLKAKLISDKTLNVKVILSGELKKPLTVKGLKLTAGARRAIEQAGGKIEE